MERMERAQLCENISELNRIRAELLGILTEAIRDLGEDRLSEESFHSVQAVWKITVDALRERRAGLTVARSAGG